MNNLTMMKIQKPAREVYEAFVDPSKICNFWWSSSSARWEKGKTITLRYDEYDAQLDIKIVELEANRKISFKWGPPGEERLVTILLKELDKTSTQIEVNEDGFDEFDAQLIPMLLDNKEGWVYMLTCLKGYLDCGVNQLRGALVK